MGLLTVKQLFFFSSSLVNGKGENHLSVDFDRFCGGGFSMKFTL